MRNIVALAKKLSLENHQSTNTGHLLLALTRSTSRSAKVLQNFGVSESKVRALLRGSHTEPERILRSMPSRAQEVTGTFQISRPGEPTAEPSDLHLLLALLKTRESFALAILNQMNVNVDTMRMHALGCLAGNARHRQTSTKRGATPHRFEQAGALPLERYLAKQVPPGSTVKKSGPGTTNTRTKPLRVNPANPGPRVPARQLIGMGREIEQIQRKKRPTPVPGAAVVSRKKARKVSHETPVPTVSTPSSPGRDGFELNKKRFPLLSSLGRNLTEAAKAGRLDAIVGRAREMEQVADVLSKRRANCPCIVGPSGVGKTALVEGLAAKLASSTTPHVGDRVIIEVRPADLLAGTSVRGSLSERLAELQKEVSKAGGNAVLFFDEIHALLSTSDGQEAVQELKAALGKGELPCIAATTTEEYVKHIEADPALARRFTKVEIAEPSEDEALQILEGIAPAYEAHHRVAFEDSALTAAVRLSDRFVHDRALPDKAVSLIDTAGARAHRQGDGTVTADDIAAILAEQIGVPAERLSTSRSEQLLRLEETLAERIVGHEHALCAIGETLRRNAAGFRAKRPIGSFLFLGPTGVGKTETAKALGDLLFPKESAFVRLDMSEFQEAHAVARLIGAPPGYVGHQEGGQLTEAVRRRPYSLVLLDEIEKAHPEVLQILLQLLDDGRLTDGLGRTVNFENTIVVLTSNLGADLAKPRRAVGFGAARSDETPSGLKEAVLSAVRAALPPELWNRIDELLVFEPLTRENALEIARRLLDTLARQILDENGIIFEVGDGMLEALADAGGYDPAFGARPMRRMIQRLVEGPLSKLILEGSVGGGDNVIGLGEDTEISFRVETRDKVRPAS